MSYKNITFLKPGKQAIKNCYRKWIVLQAGQEYESGDLEAHFNGSQYNTSDGNAKRWDYIIVQIHNASLKKSVFIEPHPIKAGNVNDMIEKLKWLKYLLNNNRLVKQLNSNNSEFIWVFDSGSVPEGSIERRMCYKANLQIKRSPISI